VQQREEWIRADIQKMDLQPNQETVDLLIHHLANTQALHAAEQIYRTIFGSQIAALKIVNLVGPKTRVELEPLYEEARSKFTNVYMDYSFQQWLDYLVSMGLLRTPDNVEYSLTTDGKEFLKWMTVESVTENKPF
jgi:hypothetical protein